jgi:hypothetical protein
MKHLVRFFLGAMVALAMGFGAGQLMAPASISAAVSSSCPDQLCTTGGGCVPGHLTSGTYCYSSSVITCFTGECDEDPPCENPWDCEEGPDAGGSSS